MLFFVKYLFIALYKVLFYPTFEPEKTGVVYFYGYESMQLR